MKGDTHAEHTTHSGYTIRITTGVIIDPRADRSIGRKGTSWDDYMGLEASAGAGLCWPYWLGL